MLVTKASQSTRVLSWLASGAADSSGTAGSSGAAGASGGAGTYDAIEEAGEEEDEDKKVEIEVEVEEDVEDPGDYHDRGGVVLRVILRPHKFYEPKAPQTLCTKGSINFMSLRPHNFFEPTAAQFFWTQNPTNFMNLRLYKFNEPKTPQILCAQGSTTSGEMFSKQCLDTTKQFLEIHLYQRILGDIFSTKNVKEKSPPKHFRKKPLPKRLLFGRDFLLGIIW